MVKKATQLSFVSPRPQIKFNPRNLVWTRDILQSSQIETFAENAGNPNGFVITLGGFLLQRT